MEFVAGCIGGAAGVIVGHPLDTIKVKLQTQDYKNPKYRGTWDCFSKTLKQSGARGLYRGITSPIAGVSAINAVIFGVHGNVSKQFEDQTAISTSLIAGGTAGLVQSFICSPVELAKTRLQVQDQVSNATKCKGPLDVIRTVYHKEGIRGVFRGQGITCARELPAFCAYFVSYELLMKKLNKDQESPSAGSILFAGGMAGIFSWVASYPIDVIKSRIQSDGLSGNPKYSGIIDCAKKSVKTEGWSVLTRGLNSTIIRAFPTNAATFFVVSAVMNLQKGESQSNDSQKESILESVHEYGDKIIHGTKDGMASISGNVCTTKNFSDQLSSNVSCTSRHIIKTGEEVTMDILSNIHKNLRFYDSYCDKMSYLNYNQLGGMM